jgi:hypothetical protein
MLFVPNITAPQMTGNTFLPDIIVHQMAGNEKILPALQLLTWPGVTGCKGHKVRLL